MKHPYALLASLWAATLLASCGGSGSTDQSGGHKVIQGAYARSQTSFELNPATHVLDGSKFRLLQQGDDFMDIEGDASDLAVNDVFLSALGSGALRRVKSVTRRTGVTHIQTSRASLSDAFTRLHIDFSKALSAADFQGNMTVVAGASLASPVASTLNENATRSKLAASVDSGGFKLKLNGVEFGPGEVKITGDVDFSVSPQFSFDYRFDVATLKGDVAYHMSMVPNLTYSVRVERPWAGGVSLEKELINAKAAAIQIPDTPLVFTPAFILKSSAELTSQGSVGSTQSGNYGGAVMIEKNFGSGIRYESAGSAKTTNTVESPNGGFKAEVKPVVLRVQMYLWDAVGPFIEVNAAGSLEGKTGFSSAPNKYSVVYTSESKLSVEAGVDGALESSRSLFGEIGIDFNLVRFNIVEAASTVHSGSLLVSPNPDLWVSVPDGCGISCNTRFELSLDGVTLGRTDDDLKLFPLWNISSGNHDVGVLLTADSRVGGASLAVSYLSQFTPNLADVFRITKSSGAYSYAILNHFSGVGDLRHFGFSVPAAAAASSP